MSQVESPVLSPVADAVVSPRRVLKKRRISQGGEEYKSDWYLHTEDLIASLKCESCETKGLERRHRVSLMHWILSCCLSIYPVRCARCFRNQLRFLPRYHRPLFTLLLVASIACNLALAGMFLKSRAKARSGDDTTLSSTGAHNGSANLSPFERLMLAKKQQLLRNDDIILLASSGVEQPLVIKLISTSNGIYDLSPRGVLRLKQSHVDNAEISAMIDHTLESAAGGQAR